MQRCKYAEGLIEHCLYLIHREIEGKEKDNIRILRYVSFLSSLGPGVPLGPMCSKTSALALTAISGCCVNAYMVKASNAAV